MKINLIALILLSTTLSYGQQVSYDAATIPAKIKENADVVKRYEDITFEVTDIDRAKYSVHRVSTVLNKNGAETLQFAVHTNKYTKLDEVEIKLYDASGKQINKYKKKDLHTTANMDGLVADGMYYYYEISTPSYPVTVEYNFQINYSGTLFYPEYSIIGEDEGVEYSSFTAKVPTELGLRFKEHQIKLAPSISKERSYDIYKWTVKELTPIKYEIGSVSKDNFFPTIMLAPNKFRIYNTYGDMTSWQKFGEWEQNLITGLDELPADRKAFFVDLVKNDKTEREKVARVYDYLQKNFRYVSIQLGIGGYQPFPAKFTDEKKYGDCKALSFYMYSVLKSIGIKSYVALINSGYNSLPVDKAFPANNFDHMILCVPQPKDSIWLECTNKTIDFALLGSFTENRNALLITEKGGVLVPTPTSKYTSNVISAVTYISLAEDGSGKTSTTVNTTGSFKQVFNSIRESKKEEQKDFIVNDFGFKQPDEFSIQKAASDLQTTINLEIEKIPEFKAGNKMFMNPRIYKLWQGILPKSEGRLHDFYFKSVRLMKDTTIFKLPQGYALDVFPKTKEIDNEFVNYKTNYWIDETKGELYSTVTFVIKQIRVGADKYPLVKKSLDEVLADGTQKIVVKRN